MQQSLSQLQEVQIKHRPVDRKLRPLPPRQLLIWSPRAPPVLPVGREDDSGASGSADGRSGSVLTVDVLGQSLDPSDDGTREMVHKTK